MGRPNGEHPDSSGGFTLIETLTALVVLATGMLGISALFIRGLSATQSSLYRSAAVMLAADMAERVRANPAAVAAYGGSAAETLPAVPCVNGSGACTAELLAADDRWRWNQVVRNRLPAGSRAVISVHADPPVTRCLISLSWPVPGRAKPEAFRLTLLL